ncbi:ABC transporter substrate-binding protein [[Clostridium] spiroforme]|nr:ABC transporter substrate-binding protein [Thomasclavelia spiroformis]
MKKAFKKMGFFVLCLTMIFSLAACSSSETKNGAIEVEDQAGRKVTFEKPAEKIVSCYYISTYACLSLDLGDELAAIEMKANQRPIYQMAQPDLLNLPQVGSLKEINIEAIAAVEPDLVILPMKLKDKLSALEELGINVLIVNPESHELLVEMLKLLGEVCDREKQADQLTEYYEDELDDIEELGQTDTRVYMAANSSYLETAPKNLYQNDLIETAGGINVAGDIEGDYWTPVSYETIIKMNPEMIVIPAGATFTEDDIYNDQQLQNIDAVTHKKVYAMPQGIEEWDSPIPSGILGTMWLASLLHEDEYSFEEFKDDVYDFYKEFYGFEIDRSLIG